LVVRRHRWFLLVLAIGVVLRIIIMRVYVPAFWYDGDSGAYLRMAGRALAPDPFRPLGYVLLLKAFRPTGSVGWVVGLQHLLGLGIAIAAYSLLVRRRVRPGLACLVVTPLVLDAFLITMEHHVLAETLYIGLLLAALAALIWNRRPTFAACVAGGGLLGLAWVTKPLVLPVVAIALVYLILRRVGWWSTIAFLIAFAVPVVTTISFVDGRPSPYGSNALALYGRVAGFANCEQLHLTPAERALCPAPQWRGMRPDWYAWGVRSPGHAYVKGNTDDPVLREFAIAVIMQQPGDYLRVVTRETGAHLVPGVDPGPEYDCLSGRYGLPATAYEPGRAVRCHPELASPGFASPPADATKNPLATPVSVGLAAYSGVFRTPSFVVTIVGLMTVLAALIGRRRQPAGARARVRDAGLLMLSSLALIVPPVLVGMYDPRYALPALPLVCVAAGFVIEYWIQYRSVLVGTKPNRQQYSAYDKMQSVVSAVQRNDVERVVAGDEQPEYAEYEIDGTDPGVGQARGASAGDGRRDHRRADGEVNDVVQRVDLEQAEQLTARVTGDRVSARDGETEQTDDDEDRSHNTRSERVEPAAGTHAGEIP
jgi:hypothetical protein